MIAAGDVLKVNWPSVVEAQHIANVIYRQAEYTRDIRGWAHSKHLCHSGPRGANRTA